MIKNSTRTERNRHRIKSSALHLLQHKIVDDITIGEIMAAADLALGTFYNYYDSREDLVDALSVDVMARHQAEIREISSKFTDPAEIFAVGIKYTVRVCFEDLVMQKLFIEPRHPGQWLVGTYKTRDTSYIFDGINSGRFDHLGNIHVFHSFLSAAVWGVIVDFKRGHLGPKSKLGEATAELGLRLLGIGDSEAKKLSALPLPKLPARETEKRQYVSGICAICGATF